MARYIGCKGMGVTYLIRLSKIIFKAYFHILSDYTWAQSNFIVIANYKNNKGNKYWPYIEVMRANLIYGFFIITHDFWISSIPIGCHKLINLFQMYIQIYVLACLYKVNIIIFRGE